MAAAQARDPATSRWADLLCLAAFGVLAAVFWQWDVLSATSPMPVFAGFDLFSEFFPRHHYAGQALREGRIPLWDPTQAAGLPFAATWQAGFFYPPNLIYGLLPTELAMGVLGRLHIFLCGAFAWLLARELAMSRAAASLAAVTYMLSGSTVFMIYHTCAINAAPWLPAALLFAWRLGRRPAATNAVALAVVLTLLFLAGRDFALVMTLHAVALLVLFQFAARLGGEDPGRATTRHLGFLAAAGLLTLGLVAVQALPTLDLAMRSGRTVSGLPEGMLEPFGTMPPRLFLANLVHPVRGPIRREYLGWIPLVLGLVAFVGSRRTAGVAYFRVLAVVSLLLVFGSQTPLYSLYAKVPLASVFRLPDRFVFLFSVSVAMLAGFGLDLLFSRRRGGAPAPVAGIAAAGAFCALVGVGVVTKWLRAGVEAANLPWGWFVFYGLDMKHFGGLGPAAVYAAATLLLVLAGYAMAGRPAAGRFKALFVVLAAADLLYAFQSISAHPEAGVSQAMSAAGCYEKLEPLLADHGRHLSLRLSDSYAVKEKDGELFGTAAATHYDPLVTKRHAVYFDLLQQGGPPIVESPWNETSAFMGMLSHGPAPSRLRLLDLLGVRALVVDAREAKRPQAFASLVSSYEPWGTCEVDSAAGPAPVALLENPRAMPRASVLYQTVQAADMEAAAAYLGRADFDPARQVVLESAGTALPPMEEQPKPAAVTIAEYAADRVVVDVKTFATGILLLTDSWDPDWTATVNGRPEVIHPANVLFRGVTLDAGDSRVVFEYHPKGFRIGAVASCLSLLAAGAWLGLARRGRRAQASGHEVAQG